MDMVRFTCTGCGKRIKAEARFAGRTGMCPACGSSFCVPTSTSDPDSTQQLHQVSALPARRRGNVWATAIGAIRTRRRPLAIATSAALSVLLLIVWVAIKEDLFPAD